jgi:hypothetical protein
MDRLNPNARLVRETAKKNNEAAHKRRQADLAAKRGCSKVLTPEQKKTLKNRKKGSRAWINGVLNNLEESFKKDVQSEITFRRDMFGIGVVEEEEEETK